MSKVVHIDVYINPQMAILDDPVKRSLNHTPCILSIFTPKWLLVAIGD